MALIAPDVVRFSLNGVYLGRPLVNVLDMVVHQMPTGLTRSEAIADVANHIVNVWVEELLPILNADYSLNSISYIDLDREDGLTGERASSNEYELPRAGGLTQAGYSSAVALLVTKVTASRRGQRSGRWFLCPPGEPDITGNIVSSAYIGAMNAALSDMVERLTETGVLPELNYFPTVIHQRNVGTASNPEYEYTGNTQITNLIASNRVSTQRRRNRP